MFETVKVAATQGKQARAEREASRCFISLE